MRTSLAIIAFILCHALGFADTINVPADQPTIQAGIDAAVNGDTVLVASGTYIENIDFTGKSILLQSHEGPYSTTIDGNSNWMTALGHVVLFATGEDENAILDGFTITNGGSACGGGILCLDSSPTIINNIISDNWAVCGGGIYCDNASPLIMDNQILNNVAECVGGGIDCWYSSPTIINNLIMDNEAIDGAGLDCQSLSSAIIKDNIISYNHAISDGAGIFVVTSDPIITNNLFEYNSAERFGGGIDIYSDSNGVVSDNAVFNNSAGEAGGGIFCDTSAPLICTNNIGYNTAKYDGGITFLECATPVYAVNNIIHHNSAQEGGGIGGGGSYFVLINNTIYGNSSIDNEYAGGIVAEDSVVTVVNSILWNNSGVGGHEIALHCDFWGINCKMDISYCNVMGGYSNVYIDNDPYLADLNWGSGMIDTNPLFVDSVDEDFHITYNSPCRDAGDNTPITELYDFENDPRIAWSGAVDMGADEFYNHLYVTGDKTPGGLIEGKLVGLPGTNPVGLFIGLSVLETPVNTTWGEFWLDSPWYLIPLLFAPSGMPGTGILILPTSIPLSPPAPYDIPIQALIGLHFDSLTNIEVLEIR